MNASEALAHQCLTGQKPSVFGSGQQGYVDIERELPTVPEDEEEEESGSEGGDSGPSLSLSPPRQDRLPQDVPIFIGRR